MLTLSLHNIGYFTVFAYQASSHSPLLDPQHTAWVGMEKDHCWTGFYYVF